MRVAAIDLGTATTRLLIADVCAGVVEELERDCIITHLGEGLAATGLIHQEAVERELAVCAGYLERIAAYECAGTQPVESIWAVATSAMRDAANSQSVLAALRQIGLEVEIISGKLEAELGFSGTLSGFADTPEIDNQAVLVIDVGGGSTELALGLHHHIMLSRSFDAGSRRITDRFLSSDPPTAGELKTARDWLMTLMWDFFAEMPIQPQLAIGVAGAATSAIAVRESLEPYDREQVHRARISAGELRNVLKDLANMNLEQRRQRVGLDPARAPIIVGGLIVLDVVLELADLDELTISETDTLHGMALYLSKR
ncbi:MAG: hypothetical protein LBR39_01390 [Coriobacteriales bacterium]|jgi:exopolyphosphatase/guanosine-5'-triphosphate,3'-diphosphate pyrophosphatase|nr:hypothetical protein [Coriobacteriales bacterium]